MYLVVQEIQGLEPGRDRCKDVVAVGIVIEIIRQSTSLEGSLKLLKYVQ